MQNINKSSNAKEIDEYKIIKYTMTTILKFPHGSSKYIALVSNTKNIIFPKIIIKAKVKCKH